MRPVVALGGGLAQLQAACSDGQMTFVTLATLLPVHMSFSQPARATSNQLVPTKALPLLIRYFFFFFKRNSINGR